MKDNRRTIEIEFIDEAPAFEYKPKEYDSYEVVNGLFVVKKGEQWIGIFPLSRVSCIHAELLEGKDGTDDN